MKGVYALAEPSAEGRQVMGWKQWAEEALKLCDAQGIDPSSEIVAALKEVQRTGYEPYYTLNGAVYRLERGEFAEVKP